MKKVKVFAVAGVTLLAAGLLAACSSSNTSKASSGEDKTMVMSTLQIQQLWTTQFLLKLLHMISLQTS